MKEFYVFVVIFVCTLIQTRVQAQMREPVSDLTLFRRVCVSRKSTSFFYRFPCLVRAQDITSGGSRISRWGGGGGGVPSHWGGAPTSEVGTFQQKCM